MRVRRVLSWAVLLLALGTSAAQAAPYPPPSEASASVDPSRIHPGECTTFSGTGFAPRVTVSLRDGDESKGTARTNDDGAFAKELCYDADAKHGRHTLYATGPTPDGTLTVSAFLMITGVEQGQGGGPKQQSAAASSDSSGATTRDSDARSLPRSDEVLGSRIPVHLDDASANSGLPVVLSALTGTAVLAGVGLLLILAERRRRRRRQRIA